MLMKCSWRVVKGVVEGWPITSFTVKVCRICCRCRWYRANKCFRGWWKRTVQIGRCSSHIELSRRFRTVMYKRWLLVVLTFPSSGDRMSNDVAIWVVLLTLSLCFLSFSFFAFSILWAWLLLWSFEVCFKWWGCVRSGYSTVMYIVMRLDEGRDVES